MRLFFSPKKLPPLRHWKYVHFPEIFEGNPYVEKTYHPNTINVSHLREQFIVHTTFDISLSVSHNSVSFCSFLLTTFCISRKDRVLLFIKGLVA